MTRFLISFFLIFFLSITPVLQAFSFAPVGVSGEPGALLATSELFSLDSLQVASLSPGAVIVDGVDSVSFLSAFATEKGFNRHLSFALFSERKKMRACFRRPCAAATLAVASEMGFSQSLVSAGLSAESPGDAALQDTIGALDELDRARSAELFTACVRIHCSDYGVLVFLTNTQEDGRIVASLRCELTFVGMFAGVLILNTILGEHTGNTNSLPRFVFLTL